MTDFYQWLTGRPSPGKRQRERFLRYANNGENREAVERAGSLRPYDDAGDLPPDWARRTAQDPLTEDGAPRVPLSQMTGRDRSGRVRRQPYGDDFVAWEGEVRASEMSPALRREEPPPEGDGPTNPGREPRDPGNVIADAPRGERGEIWHGSEFWQDWHGAEMRARERWQEGKPTAWDMVFTAIYGRRDRLDEMQEDTEEMRQSARNPRD